MKITLRKASAIQLSINDALKSISIDAMVRLNEFQDAEAEISRASTVLKDNIIRRDRLVEVLYEIRKAVSAANSSAGIDNRLADIAHLDKQIQFYTGLADNKVREDAKVIAGRLDKIRNDKSESRSRIYGYADTVDTTVFTQGDLDIFRGLVSKTKKAKQALQDEVLEINVRTEIALSERAEQVLQTEGLI